MIEVGAVIRDLARRKLLDAGKTVKYTIEINQRDLVELQLEALLLTGAENSDRVDVFMFGCPVVPKEEIPAGSYRIQSAA